MRYVEFKLMLYSVVLGSWWAFKVLNPVLASLYSSIVTLLYQVWAQSLQHCMGSDWVFKVLYPVQANPYSSVSVGFKPIFLAQCLQRCIWFCLRLWFWGIWIMTGHLLGGLHWLKLHIRMLWWGGGVGWGRDFSHVHCHACGTLRDQQGQTG